MVELPDRVVVAVGETITFVLGAAWRGGYRWSASADRSGIATVEVGLDDGSPAPGAAPEELVVRGVSPGDVVVDVRLARSWEHDAADEHRIHVHVRDRGPDRAP
jgi:hypothetical protein